TNAAGLQVDFNGGSATATSFLGGGWNTGFSTSPSSVHITALTTTASDAPNGTTGMLFIKAVLVVNSGGTFILRGAQTASNGNTVTLYKGSSMKLTKLN